MIGREREYRWRRKCGHDEAARSSNARRGRFPLAELSAYPSGAVSRLRDISRADRRRETGGPVLGGSARAPSCGSRWCGADEASGF